MKEDIVKLAFFSWIEIPYTIGINYEKVITVDYSPVIGKVELRIKFRNDLLRIKVGNHWTEEKPDKIQLFQPNQPNIFFVPLFATEADLPDIKKLVKEYELPYLHIEQPKTVIELYTELSITNDTYQCVTDSHSTISEVFPTIDFFNTQVLPQIAQIVDTYRVATISPFRFSLLPVSEYLFESVPMQIQDTRTGKIVQRLNYKNDNLNYSHSIIKHYVERSDIQSRFDSLINGSEDFEFELQFCSAYYLFNMRRWAEATMIACGVVDSLVREAVFAKYKLNPSEAELFLEQNKNKKFKDFFNKILPSLEYGKLSECDQRLWLSFLEAKNFRGSAAHGKTISALDSEQEKIVLGHLRALYEVARWLSTQMGRNWMLDANANGESFSLF